ncbi:MAG: phosphatidate cytidylyltransferase [Rudaea sp.]
MLRTRLITAIVLIPLVVGAVVLGGWWLFALMGSAMVLCGYEYFTILHSGGYRPERAVGVVLIAALLVDALLQLRLQSWLLVLAVIVPPIWEFRRAEHSGFLVNWSLTVLGVLYIGLLGGYMFLLRARPDGLVLLAVTLLATWAADAAAYGVGRSIGRRPFFQHISPKKTWEGAIGGVAGSAIAFGVLMSIYGLNPFVALLCGIGLGVAAAVGDLLESLIKRQVMIKDSGTLIVGHGGVLDRLDSMFFTVAFAYFFFALIGNA